MNPPRTILIADDHTRTREIIRRLCTRPDDVIIEAGDGAEAVKAFEKQQPDWVLMDLDMPVMDGLTALQLIRERSPEARVVVVTQHDAPELQAHATQLGAHAWIRKDDLEQLHSILAAAPPLSGSPTNPVQSPNPHQP